MADLQLTLETVATVRPAIPFRTVDTLVERNAIAGLDLVDGLHVYVNADNVLYKYDADDEVWSAYPTQQGVGIFRVVADATARDAISGDDLVEGMHVVVLSERRRYERYGDDTWKLLEVLPDLTLRDELTDAGAFAIRYCSSAGSDLTGDGSIGNPYRQWQRWVDSIPTGCHGWAELRLMDAGPYIGSVNVRNLLTADLFLTIITGAASVLDVKTAMSTPTRVTNTQPGGVAGGVKSGHARNNVGAHGAITNGSHYVRGTFTSGSANVPIGHTVYAPESASPNLGVIDPYWGSTMADTVAGYDTIDLVPIGARVIADPSVGYVLLKSAPENNLAIIGCFVDDPVSTVFVQGPISLQGWAITDPGSFFLHEMSSAQNLQDDLFCAGTVLSYGIGASDYFLRGDFRAAIALKALHATLVGVVDFDGVGPHVFIGFASNAGPHVYCGCNFHMHFAGSIGSNIQTNMGSLRFYDDGSFSSVDGQSPLFLLADWNAIINMRQDDQPSIFGTTTGVCVQLKTGSQSRGFGGHDGGAGVGGLRNRVTPGNDIDVGGSGTKAWADLPTTDIAAGALSQFVRAE